MACQDVNQRCSLLRKGSGALLPHNQTLSCQLANGHYYWRVCSYWWPGGLLVYCTWTWGPRHDMIPYTLHVAPLRPCPETQRPHGSLCVLSSPVLSSCPVSSLSNPHTPLRNVAAHSGAERSAQLDRTVCPVEHQWPVASGQWQRQRLGKHR